MKGIKTSIVAFIILLVGVGLVAALVFDKMEKDEFSMAMGAVAVFGASVIGWVAADQPKK